MSENFNKADWPSPIFVERSFFRSEDENFQELYEKSPVVAADLPSILELDDGKANKPTIVILGQDAKSDQDTEKLRIGTPYALHLKQCRESFKTTKFYFEMIEVLLNLGYKVYLTDIFKIWVCNPNRPYYRARLPKVDQSKFVAALTSELKIVQPLAVITWGREASHSVSKIALDFSHISFPHPGGAANGTWQTLLQESPTRGNKLAYWKREILKVL